MLKRKTKKISNTLLLSLVALVAAFTVFSLNANAAQRVIEMDAGEAVIEETTIDTSHDTSQTTTDDSGQTVIEDYSIDNTTQTITNTSTSTQTIIEESTTSTSQTTTESSSQTVVDSPTQTVSDSTKLRFETGAVMPQYGPPGQYRFTTYLIYPENRTPEYVKIFIEHLGDESTRKSYDMKRESITTQGIQYSYEHTFPANEEGNHNFYFEAKVGDKVIHGPSYFGDDCIPGLCATCCGEWGGPKIISQELIDEHKIYLFKKDKDQPLWSYDVGKNWVTSVAISPDGKNTAAADNQGNLYLFSNSSNQPIWTFTGEFDSSSGDIASDRGLVAFSNNGYLVAGLKGVVYLFKTDSNMPVWQHNIGMTLNGVVISQDAKYIAAGGMDTKVYFWNSDSSEPAWSYKVESEGGIMGGSVIRAMNMTPDGKYFTAGTSCPDRSVYVFNPDQSEPIFRAQVGSNFPAETVSISDDGQYVLVGGGGSDEDPYAAVLFKIGQDELLWKFDYDKNPTLKVAISADGKSYVLGYILSGIIFGSSDSKNPTWQLKNSGYIADLTFSENGKYLAAGSGTHHVFLLSADGSQLHQDWEVDNKVESIAISTDGQYIVAGTSLDRFVIIGEYDGNVSGSGSGDIQDIEPELKNVSGLTIGLDTKTSVVNSNTNTASSASEDQTVSQSNRSYIWLLFVAGGLVLLLILTTFLIIKKKAL